MEQTDWLFWAVAFAFYLPLHAGSPLLYLLIQGDIETLKAQKNRLLLHSFVSAAMAFLIAVFAWPYSQGIAIGAILVATVLPWIGINKDK